MNLYTNKDGGIGYQAAYMESGSAYIHYVSDEAIVPVIEHELRRTGETLEEVVDGGLEP